MRIIGLTGLAGSGKTTAASILKQYGYQEVAMANKLKDECSRVFRIPRINFDDQSLKEIIFATPICLGFDDIINMYAQFNIGEPDIKTVRQHIGVQLISPRHIAQYVGTDILRAFNDNIHVRSAMETLDSNKKYVFSDIRFWNEFAAIKESSGIIIGITRGDNSIPDMKTHISEQYVPHLIKESDVQIINNSSIEEFESKIRYLLTEVEMSNE